MGGLVATLLACSGCDSVLTTAQLPAVRDDSIAGEWKDLGTPGSDPDKDPLSIRFMDGKYWSGSPDDFRDSKASPFTVARIGSVLIAQFAEESACDAFGVADKQPCFNLAVLEPMGDRMNIYDLDASRLARESVEGMLDIPHSLHLTRGKDGSTDTTVLFSADASDLSRFLEAYVKRSGVFKQTGRLQRVPETPQR
jgi:hypothetical protein